MKKIATILLSVMIVIFMLSACLKEKSEILPMSPVDISMYDILSTTTRELQLSIETTQLYECGNCTIRFDKSVVDGKIMVNLKDIEQPSLCVGTDIPAHANIMLGTMTNGEHPIEIKIGSISRAGTITVSDSMYVLNIDTESQQMLNVAYDTLQRIPENTIWGLVAYYYTSDVSTANFFLDSLENLGASHRFLTPGEYGYFQVDTTGNIVEPQNPGYAGLKTFDYSYTNSFDDIEDLISHMDFFYPGDLVIYLYNWKGQTFQNGYN